ncbi:MAG: acyltransferase, partial [Pyrinomonadaceae bacterium]|nr:acyltransferase [Pyrinomonadaceae bacterium]
MSGYKPQLDSLRAFAVLVVLIGHFAGVPSAIQGVQLFFVLSGFLITSILLDCKSQIEGQDASRGFLLREFYIRRFLRIFPPYYALLMGLVLIQLTSGTRTSWGPATSFWQSLGFHATYTSNVWFAFTGRWDPWATSHFWSLAIEEQFYLFWPLIVLWVPRRSLWLAATLLIALGPVSRWLMLAHGANKIAFGTLTPAYFDFLGLGAFLAIVGAQPRAQFVLRLFGITAGAVLAIGASFAMNFKGTDVFLWALAFTGLVSKASEGLTGP